MLKEFFFKIKSKRWVSAATTCTQYCWSLSHAIGMTKEIKGTMEERKKIKQPFIFRKCKFIQKNSKLSTKNY